MHVLVQRRGRLLQGRGVGQHALQELLGQELPGPAPGTARGAVAPAPARTPSPAGTPAAAGADGRAGGQVVEGAAGQVQGGQQRGAAVVDHPVEAAVRELRLGAGGHVGADLVALQVHLQHRAHHVAHPAPPARRRAPEARRHLARPLAVHVARQRDEEVGRGVAELAVALVVVVLPQPGEGSHGQGGPGLQGDLPLHEGPVVGVLPAALGDLGEGTNEDGN